MGKADGYDTLLNTCKCLSNRGNVKTCQNLLMSCRRCRGDHGKWTGMSGRNDLSSVHSRVTTASLFLMLLLLIEHEHWWSILARNKTVFTCSIQQVEEAEDDDLSPACSNKDNKTCFSLRQIMRNIDANGNKHRLRLETVTLLHSRIPTLVRESAMIQLNFSLFGWVRLDSRCTGIDSKFLFLIIGRVTMFS